MALEPMYDGTITLTLFGFNSEDEGGADDEIHNFINQLCNVKTDLSWDVEDWTLNELI